MNNVVVVDTETGGLDPQVNGLCSITMKKYGEENKAITWYIKPQKELEYHPRAMQVNGLTLEELEQKGLPEAEVLKQMKEFVYDNFGTTKPQPLGHNVQFDVAFLKELFKRNGLDYEKAFHYHFRDSMVVANFLRDVGLFNAYHVGLGACFKEVMGVDLVDAHTSEADVLATEKVYAKFVDMLKNRKVYI